MSLPSLGERDSVLAHVPGAARQLGILFWILFPIGLQRLSIDLAGQQRGSRSSCHPECRWKWVQISEP